MIEKEGEGRIIHDSDFNLTDEMNSKIVGLLRLKNNDVIAMYAAKLIEHYQCKERQIMITSCRNCPHLVTNSALYAEYCGHPKEIGERDIINHDTLPTWCPL